MTSLALQKLAFFDENDRLRYRKDGHRILMYLLKPTTTREMAEPFYARYIKEGMALDDYRQNYIAGLLRHASENFEQISLEAHLELLEFLMRQKGDTDRGIYWEANTFYFYLHKLVSNHYAENMDEELKLKLERLVTKTTNTLSTQKINVNCTLPVVFQLQQMIGDHTPGIVQYFETGISRRLIPRLHMIYIGYYLNCLKEG